MEKKRVFGYVFLGEMAKYFEDVTEGLPTKGRGQVLENLERFIERLDELDLPVTSRAAQTYISTSCTRR